ncbi:hypothetical protein F52700_6321 [Fusarium sp. NRRL 52700]|nr:hypothetical protein F52700_6321 [Fusarium sp. NRRL 52700]
MPKRRFSSDSGDDTPRKISKVSNQQTKHHVKLDGTVSSLRRCSLSQAPNEVEPKTQLLTPERNVWLCNEEPTSLEKCSSSVGSDTDNSAEESSDGSDLEESLKSPRPEGLQEMADEIKKLKKIIKSKTFIMKYWRDSTKRLEMEVEVLKAKLEAINKEPTQI